MRNQCIKCGEFYSDARHKLGYRTCLQCGEQAAKQRKHCIVPMHKSSLTVITEESKDLLKGINEKGGNVK